MAGEDAKGEIKRWLVTVGAIGLYFIGVHVPLPGVAHLSFLSDPDRVSTGISVFDLSVMPIVRALALAEIARLAFPPLARWIARGPNQAALYLRIIRALALVVAAAQALGFAAGLRAAHVVYENGWPFELEIVAAFVGATAVLILLTGLINAKGIGDGLVLFYAAASLPAQAAVWWRFRVFFAAYVPLWLLTLTLLSIAALIAVSRRRSPNGPLDLWTLLLGTLLLQRIGPWIGTAFATELGPGFGVVANVLLAAGLFALVAIRRARVDQTRLDAAAALLLTVEFVVWLGARLILELSPGPLAPNLGFNLILCVAAALSVLPAWRGGRALAPG